jgi:hypothetical protein
LAILQAKGNPTEDYSSSVYTARTSRSDDFWESKFANDVVENGNHSTQQIQSFSIPNPRDRGEDRDENRLNLLNDAHWRMLGLICNDNVFHSGI